MEFSRQEYWGGLPFPTPGDLPDPGIKPTFLASPALAGKFFYHCANWEASKGYTDHDKKHSQSQDLQGNNLSKVLNGVTS